MSRKKHKRERRAAFGAQSKALANGQSSQAGKPEGMRPDEPGIEHKFIVLTNENKFLRRYTFKSSHIEAKKKANEEAQNPDVRHIMVFQGNWIVYELLVKKPEVTRNEDFSAIMEIIGRRGEAWGVGTIVRVMKHIQGVNQKTTDLINTKKTEAPRAVNETALTVIPKEETKQQEVTLP